jgi:hypothetical protein
MKATSSGHNNITSISRLAIAGAIALLALGFAAAPPLRAEIPADQIKSAGAIPLTTDLLDKMDKVIKNLSASDAAKAELAVVGKDPTVTPETWGNLIATKCPKAAEIFKAANVTPDDFVKAEFAIMAVAMGDELAKSEDKTVKANYDFVAANKERASALFAGFMSLQEPAPAPKP